VVPFTRRIRFSAARYFILEQEFLIDQPGDVRQQPRTFVLWHEEHPS
jgi:hypothetical protein